MGYFYFRSQVLNKAKNSALASASYRSGDSLYSERDGLQKNYKERTVKPEAFILAPKHAPDWVHNRERLWNEVEKIEKQRNAQIAREIQVALPRELSNKDQKDMLIHFCKSNFSDEGMVADIAIHRDKEANPHAHIMLTMRPFDENGEWGNKRKKVLQNVEGKMKKVSVHLTNWNEKETMVKWRENYAECINQKLKENGKEDFVSHKSYKDQGLEQLPTVRLSRESYQVEIKEMDRAVKQNIKYEPVTFYGQLNEEIRYLNKEMASVQELKKQPVISLNDYKTEKSYEEKLKDIHSSINLSSTEKEALNTITKRAKSFINYDKSVEVLNDLKTGYWKKGIDNDSVKILAQKNIVNKAYTAFKDDSKLVIRYGFNPHNFNEELKEKISLIKEQELKVKANEKNYNSLLEKANLVYKNQKELVEKEFNTLYQTDKLFHVEQMNLAVQQFKKTGTIIPIEKINSLVKDTGNKNITFDHNLVDQSKELSKSVFILNRAINKQTKERIEHLKNRDLEKAYNSSLKIEQYTLQKERTEKELSGNKELLKSNIEKHYDIDLDSSIDIEMYIRLQEKINKNETTGDINKDSKEVLSEIKEDHQTNEVQPTPEKEVQRQYTSGVINGLMQSLEQIGKDQKSKKEKEFNRNRKRSHFKSQDIDR